MLMVHSCWFKSTYYVYAHWLRTR